MAIPPRRDSGQDAATNEDIFFLPWSDGRSASSLAKSDTGTVTTGHNETSRHGWMIPAAILCHIALLAWGAADHSPSVDEVGHLVAGVSHWQFGRFDLYRVNPPLVRLVAALPVVLSQPETDWSDFSELPTSRSEFPCGRKFIERNGTRSLWLFTLARWVCIPFSLLGAGMCYLWGRDLYGPAAGRLACVLWCFSPTILGQAQMITPDTGATSLGLAAAYVFWQWLRRPDFAAAGLAGIVLGLTLLTKGTWIILFGLWPALWLMWRVTSRLRAPRVRLLRVRLLRGATWPHELLQGVWMFVLALFVLSCGYGFERVFEPMGRQNFISHALTGTAEIPSVGANRFAGSWLGQVRLPVPANYLLGIDVQKRDFEDGFRSYLRGEWQDGGWWYFYAYAWLIKEPLAIWCLVGMVLLEKWLRLRHSFRKTSAETGDSGSPIGTNGINGDPSTETTHGAVANASPATDGELVLGLTATAVLVLVSSQTGFTHHFRYILPCVPALYIWLGQLAAGGDGRADQGRQRLVTGTGTFGPRWRRWVVRFCVMWFVVASVWSAPNQLSHFNELASGSTGGRFHLIDSNLDWGQDLPALKRWYDAHPAARPFHLAYFGMMDPRVMGIEYSLPPKGLVVEAGGRRDDETTIGPLPGWHAVSVTTLMGHYFFFPDGHGGRELIATPCFTYFQEFQPVAQAGHSIFIYHVTSEQANHARARLGLRPLPAK